MPPCVCVYCLLTGAAAALQRPQLDTCKRLSDKGVPPASACAVCSHRSFTLPAVWLLMPVHCRIVLCQQLLPLAPACSPSPPWPCGQPAPAAGRRCGRRYSMWFAGTPLPAPPRECMVHASCGVWLAAEQLYETGCSCSSASCSTPGCDCVAACLPNNCCPCNADSLHPRLPPHPAAVSAALQGSWLPHSPWLSLPPRHWTSFSCWRPLILRHRCGWSTMPRGAEWMRRR